MMRLILLPLLCYAAAVSTATAQQMVRLPSVADRPAFAPYDGVPVQYHQGSLFQLTATPQQMAEPVLDGPDQQLIEPTPQKVGRDGAFQNLSFEGTWLAGGDSGGDDSTGDLGVSDLYASATFGFPAPTRESPLLVTPSFEVNYLDGPVAPDLPARVYDVAVQFRYLRKLTPRLAMDISVAPGVHSDFVANPNSFRITGRGLGIYDWSETTKVVLGVVYLDRPDVSVLPAAGIVYTPGDDWRWELVVPRPRVAVRLYSDGGISDHYFPEGAPHEPGAEWWAYVAGELGGGVWAIRRDAGFDDVVSATDYRVLLGLERKVPTGGVSGRFEVGYVFARELEFASDTPDFDPDDTVLLRMGVSY